jgi:hypothetical protein
MNDDLQKLYNALISKGYSTDDIGNENQFREYMSNRDNRKYMYNWINQRNDFKLGSYDAYEERLRYLGEPDTQLSEQQRYHEGEDIRKKDPDQVSPKSGAYDPSKVMDSLRNVDGIDEDLNKLDRYGVRVETKQQMDARKAKEEQDREAFKQYVEDTGIRQKVEGVKQTAEQQIEEARGKENFWERSLRDYVAPLFGFIGGKVVDTLLSSKDERAAQTAITKANEALDVLDEAEHADKGFVDKQLGGIVRGMVDEGTKASTWDLGARDLIDAGTLIGVVDKW